LAHSPATIFFARSRIAGVSLIATAASLVAACLIAISPLPATAQESYPDKVITMVVPFPAGGTTDILARVVGQYLSDEFGQQVIIENRGGAGGNIGSQAVAQAEPDGYTLLMGTVGTHAINASLYASMPFDPVKDFQPLSRVAMVPNLLVANPQQPFKTVQELIDYAKANPGTITYASSGNGTSIHLSAELFKTMAGVDMLHVPYKGSALALTDLLGNQVAIMFDNLPSAIQHVRAGKLRAIAVTSAKRSPQLPNTPTIAEAGLPGYEATSWFGLFAPAGTPQPVVDKLNAAIVKAIADPKVSEQFEHQGAEPYPETPAEFAAFIEAELVKWGKVVKDSGARVD
jgi:tripartite-type tricarboxylate transporter receptor subunit TctC